MPVVDILMEVGRMIKKYHLLKQLPKGTLLFRCRQHGHGRLTDVAEFTAPPVEKAVVANRMSPVGIPMFYGAFKMEIAKLETVDEQDLDKNEYTVGMFRNQDSLNMVDFSRLPPYLSIFDSVGRKNSHPLKFLYNFVKDLSRPIRRDDHPHIEYIPTQVVTEYIRFMLKKNSPCHGIVYPSAKKPGETACVLFMDQQQCLKELEFDPDVLTHGVI